MLLKVCKSVDGENSEHWQEVSENEDNELATEKLGSLHELIVYHRS